MSLYQVQKLIYHVNRDSERRQRYSDNAQAFVKSYDLTEAESVAILNVNVRALYKRACIRSCCGRLRCSTKSPTKTTPKR